jgi:hypothetical protein
MFYYVNHESVFVKRGFCASMWIPGIIVNVHDDDGALDINLDDGSQDLGVSRLFVAHRHKSEHQSPPEIQKLRAENFVFDLVRNKITTEHIDAVEWDCAIIAEIDKTTQTRVDVPSEWFPTSKKQWTMQIQDYKWVHSKKKWQYDVSYREKDDDQIDQNGYVTAQLYMDAKSLEHSLGDKQENLF